MNKPLLKNLYTAIGLLFIAAFLLPQQAEAQEENGLYLAGTAVTAENYNDLSVIEGVSGKRNMTLQQKRSHSKMPRFIVRRKAAMRADLQTI